MMTAKGFSRIPILVCRLLPTHLTLRSISPAPPFYFVDLAPTGKKNKPGRRANDQKPTTCRSTQRISSLDRVSYGTDFSLEHIKFLTGYTATGTATSTSSTSRVTQSGRTRANWDRADFCQGTSSIYGG